MTSFHDVVFPLRLAFGASGGPVRATQITALASGGEVRNNPHRQSRRRYNAAAGLKSHADLQNLVDFFEARQGQLYGFRFRDPLDHKSCALNDKPQADDQFIGLGDGQETRFQLLKIYGDQQSGYNRKITKPAAGSVLVSVDGTKLTGDEFTLDALTGIVALSTPARDGAVVRAGFRFDVPVRFDVDHLDLSLEAFGAGEITQIPLLELLYA
jgi:uncharacterized protein (TIGR02217 family)